MNQSPISARRFPSKTAESPPPIGYWNYLVLVAYHVVVRIGWIFKTESIVMPAVLDSVVGAGWLRGFLPVLNRIGQSVPPMLAAELIRKSRLKKQLLFACALFMGLSFLLLAVVWSLFGERHSGWLGVLFLVVYGLFWFCVGIHNLVANLLQGKLIAVRARGRMMLMATVIGAALAIGAAYWLIPPWLRSGTDGFVWFFGASGVTFLFGAALVMLLREPADGEDAGTGLPIAASTFRTSWMILSRDANFRRLAWIAACYGMSVSLVPHYVAYVRESLSIGMEGFLPWLIAQNIGAALFSIPLGQTADRAGNRLAIQWTMIGLTAAPLLSVCWVQWLASLPNIGFSLIFLLLGLTPISMRVFQNYTLEIVPRPQQPIYLSTLGACMAFPVVAFSIPVGWVVDVAGFEPVFWLVIVILLISWVMTFGLSEPRDGFETDGTLGPLMTGPK